jgi:MSHA type pilus biogenesis protein MshL
MGEVVQCDGCPAPIIDRTAGTISVTASRRIQKEVKKYLALLEESTYKQVVIEAKIIEVSLTEHSAIGIDWEGVFSGVDVSGKEFGGNVGLGDPATDLLYSAANGWERFLTSITIDDVPWSVVVSAFGEYGDTKILANPKLHILNGHSAILSAGQVLSYLEGCDVTQTDFGGIAQEAEINSVTEGLTVGIKANIINDEEIILYVFPAITRLIQFRSIFESACGRIEAPEMAVREMATYAKVNNGSILVIGGLIQETNETVIKKVPVLGDIPYIGKYLFSYEEIDSKTQELVILLKPKIVTTK